MMKEKIKVSELMCGGCVERIESKMKTIGVTFVFDMKSGIATVEFDPNQITLAQIVERIDWMGFPAEATV